MSYEVLTDNSHICILNALHHCCCGHTGEKRNRGTQQCPEFTSVRCQNVTDKIHKMYAEVQRSNF